MHVMGLHVCLRSPPEQVSLKFAGACEHVMGFDLGIVLLLERGGLLCVMWCVTCTTMQHTKLGSA